MIDKEYLREQAKNPTGHYTEILIRTYYFILKKCEEKNQDFALRETFSAGIVEKVYAVCEPFSNQPSNV